MKNDGAPVPTVPLLPVPDMDALPVEEQTGLPYASARCVNKKMNAPA